MTGNETVDQSLLCESCKQVNFQEEVFDDHDVFGYKVCSSCADRLRNLSLRPIEWFNLASIHTVARFLLHDDFYDDDGSACDPQLDNYTTKGFLAPTLQEAMQSLDTMIDYTITRWFPGKEEFNGLSQFSKQDVLLNIQKRYEKSTQQLTNYLTICANVIGVEAEVWVRDKYEVCKKDDIIFDWGEAAAKCLPAEEGLEKTIQVVDINKDNMLALMWFQSSKVLDWIEDKAPPSNITDKWGRLACVSHFSWDRVLKWLSLGRPLSLIAIDAMRESIPRSGQGLIFRKLKPVLHSMPDTHDAIRALEDYMGKDDSPRVIQRCGYIIDNIERINKSS